MKLLLNPLHLLLRYATAALAFGAGAAAVAQPPPSWRGGWYHTEVIVFQRPAVSAASAAERLLTHAPQRWPAALLSLAAPGSDTAVYYEEDAEHGSCRAVPAGLTGPGGAIPLAFGAAAQPYQPATQSPTELKTEVPPAAAAGAETLATSAAAEPEPTEPAPEQQLQLALEQYESQLQSDSLHWLPGETLTLGREAARLRASGYAVLMHRRWIQDVPARGAPQPIQIWVEDAGGTGPQLAGTLQVTRGRFMHVDANLWYRDGSEVEAGAYMILRESRRMRLGELHYLDHPKLGVLVRTTRVGLPETILEAFAALRLQPEIEEPEPEDEFSDPTAEDLLDL